MNGPPGFVQLALNPDPEDPGENPRLAEVIVVGVGKFGAAAIDHLGSLAPAAGMVVYPVRWASQVGEASLGTVLAACERFVDGMAEGRSLVSLQHPDVFSLCVVAQVDVPEDVSCLGRRIGQLRSYLRKRRPHARPRIVVVLRSRPGEELSGLLALHGVDVRVIAPIPGEDEAEAEQRAVELAAAVIMARCSLPGRQGAEVPPPGWSTGAAVLLDPAALRQSAAIRLAAHAARGLVQQQDGGRVREAEEFLGVLGADHTLAEKLLRGNDGARETLVDGLPIPDLSAAPLERWTSLIASWGDQVERSHVRAQCERIAARGARMQAELEQELLRRSDDLIASGGSVSHAEAFVGALSEAAAPALRALEDDHHELTQTLSDPTPLRRGLQQVLEHRPYPSALVGRALLLGSVATSLAAGSARRLTRFKLLGPRAFLWASVLAALAVGLWFVARFVGGRLSSLRRRDDYVSAIRKRADALVRLEALARAREVIGELVEAARREAARLAALREALVGDVAPSDRGGRDRPVVKLGDGLPVAVDLPVGGGLDSSRAVEAISGWRAHVGDPSALRGHVERALRIGAEETLAWMESLDLAKVLNEPEHVARVLDQLETTALRAGLVPPSPARSIEALVPEQLVLPDSPRTVRRHEHGRLAAVLVTVPFEQLSGEKEGE